MHVPTSSAAGAIGTTSAMLEDLRALVCAESPSSDPVALGACAEVLAGIGERLLGTAPEIVEVEGIPQVSWSFGGTPTVLLLGHLDTVWPLGALEDHPWSTRDGLVRGPGVFDMKAGLVQALHALAALDPWESDGITLLVTADEEVAAPTSRERILREAAAHPSTLVLEASAPGGALKTARRGVGHYTLEVNGRAAHAGLEPASGINATIELAHQVLAVSALDAGPAGATVTPTLIEGGTTINTVPAFAAVAIDVRTPSLSEQERVEQGLADLRPVLPGALLELSGGVTHPPLEPSSSEALYGRAVAVARELGLGPLGRAAVGGASDGNIAASAGSRVLDGLGAVGGGAHAADEHVVVEEMPRRAALVTGLLRSLTGDPL
ncbi:M20/M25/M40 family metallo-hydrolase [Actinomyces polynesiensis]|uniref:M20/M25/M40 family metallo-hydrolase n=1 Tax=Actinomyces polynesiensis TaxID=1325934 RepID=UPI001C9BD8F7|nr:M20/M25/M40 family metallo-hydrolase [Actinomyces polynesiensis]